MSYLRIIGKQQLILQWHHLCIKTKICRWFLCKHACPEGLEQIFKNHYITIGNVENAYLCMPCLFNPPSLPSLIYSHKRYKKCSTHNHSHVSTQSHVISENLIWNVPHCTSSHFQFGNSLLVSILGKEHRVNMCTLSKMPEDITFCQWGRFIWKVISQCQKVMQFII